MLVYASKLIGAPVLSVQAGGRIAVISEAIVDPDTLKDRFVRGSKSRSTEGFGLGLSISENLVKSMNGKLEITSIQDLFTVKMVFVSYED